jgi:hypothetical protein
MIAGGGTAAARCNVGALLAAEVLMNDPVTELMTQAEALSSDQRERLAELLLSSVEPLHADWTDELLARQAEANVDPTAMVDFDEAIASARVALASRRAV